MRTILLLCLVAFAGCTEQEQSIDETPEQPPAPAPAVGGAETWYLHDSDTECDGSGETTLSKADDADDADGCGGVGAAGLADGFTVSFAGTESTGGHAQGTAVTARIYVAFTNPGEYTLAAALRSNGTEVASGSVTMTAVSAYGVGPFVEFSVPMTLERAMAAGDRPSLTINVSGGPSYFLGYEGDHTSILQIG